MSPFITMLDRGGFPPITSTSVVVDIGSNEGQEIEPFVNTGCEIHSFEPHPKLFRELEKKYSSFKNVHLNELAAWKSDTKMKFYYKKSLSNNSTVNGGASLIGAKENIDLELNVEVDCIDIAKYILNLNKTINFLKIDAEGAEYEILNRLFETNAYQKIDHIYYEDHSRKINVKTGSRYEKLLLDHENKWRKLKNEVLLKYKENNIVLNNWH